MVGTYTNIAIRRSNQSKEPVTTHVVAPVETAITTQPSPLPDATSSHQKPVLTDKTTQLPESQHAGMPANQQTGKPVFQQASKLEVQPHTTATEKVTYRLHPEGKYAIEDMKTILARKHNIKASYEQIAEEAILAAYEDLLENQQASKLARRLARTPENQKSS